MGTLLPLRRKADGLVLFFQTLFLDIVLNLAGK